MSDTTTTYEKCLAFRMSLTVPEWEAMIERVAKLLADFGVDDDEVCELADELLRAALEVTDEQ